MAGWLEAALESADPAQPATLEATSRAIRELFAQAQIPADIAGAVASESELFADDDCRGT